MKKYDHKNTRLKKNLLKIIAKAKIQYDNKSYEIHKKKN